MRQSTGDRRCRLLVVSLEPLPPAGAPASRTLRLASDLPGVEVTLAIPAAEERAGPPGEIRTLAYEPGGAALRAALRGHDAILVPASARNDLSFLGDAGVPVVVDLGVPSVREELDASGDRPADAHRAEFSEHLRVLADLLRAGDFFLCATEAQREFYLGMLFALHRVNPHTRAESADFRRLIDVVDPGAEGRSPRLEPLRDFCARPRRAPDHGLYTTDLERVAHDRGEAIESLLEFNYWHQSSQDRGGAILALEGKVRSLEEELARCRRELEARTTSSLRDLVLERVKQRLGRSSR